MKKRFLFLLLICSLIIFANGQNSMTHKRLKVSANGHYLVYEDGSPFFWLGDTGWKLFLRLTLTEIEEYFDDRVKKGFNVIQVVIPGIQETVIQTTNQNGEVAFIDGNPATPNENYFLFVDSVIALAQSKGLYMCLLPTWGNRVSPIWEDPGLEIFDTTNAYTYGSYLGNRYKKYPNIIWMLGGDRAPRYLVGEISWMPDFQGDYRPVWDAMANGILAGTQNNALITFHSGNGNITRSSTVSIHDRSWLDFPTTQSGHTFNARSWRMISIDWNLAPAKPVLDAEPIYETAYENAEVQTRRATAYDVRKANYRSVFAGGAGLTYGNNNIWQFYSSKYPAEISANNHWTNAVNDDGAYQMGYLKTLMESRPQLTRVPDDDLIISGQGTGGKYIGATRDSIGSYIMIYIPLGKTITVNTKSIKSENLSVWWFNPKTAEVKIVGLIANSFNIKFTTPGFGFENDWVLVVDNPECHYNIPFLN